MSAKVYNTLFICTGNSARSIMAEVVLNHFGLGRFKAYSAGTNPRGTVHPMTLEVLAGQGYSQAGLRSKSWSEFANPDAPAMDFIFTVCDSAAGESCPAWPGQPITAHWGFADPAVIDGDDETRRKAFADVQRQIAGRIRLFLSIPIEKIDRLSLQTQLRELGRQHANY